MTSCETVPPLTDLTLEITNYCLLACLHCSSEANRRSSEQLSLQVIKEVMNDFKELGGKRIEISGGEPLCYGELPEVIRHAKKLDLETSLFSCGVFDRALLKQNDGLLSRKVRQLRKLGLDEVVVSLHGSYEELHNSISKRKSFRPTVRFIRELVKRGISVGVHFVPVHDNFDNIDDLEAYCKHLKVRQMGLLRFVPQGRGKQNEKRLRLSEEQTLVLTELLAKKATEKEGIFRVGRHLDFTFFFRKGHRPEYCSAGISKCVITPKGWVLPCPVFKGLKQFVAGDLRRANLREIWKGSQVFKRLRGFDPERLKGPCRDCGYRSACRGGCPAQRFYEHGDLYVGPDPYCPREVTMRMAMVIP